MSRVKFLLKLLIALLVIVAIVIAGKKAIKTKQEKEAKTPTAKIYPIYVKAIKPEKSNVLLTLPYLAEAQNNNDLTINSKIAARVLSIKNSGERVKKGEVIAKLDTSDIKAQIESAKINLNNLLLSHKRSKALYKVKGVSIEQLQKEQNQIASLKSKLKQLKNQLSYATIISVVDGIVSKKMASVGEVAMPGKPLLNIKAESGYYLLVRLPQDSSAKEIIYNNKIYKLEDLHSTYQGLKEYKAYVEGKLNTGELVDISVVTYHNSGYKLPFDAILNRNGKSYYFIAKGKKAIAKRAKIIAKGQEGVVLKNIDKKSLVIVEKPDILLRLLSGADIALIKE